MKKLFLIPLELFFFLFFFHCAHIEPPSGGPEDKTPPYLTGVYPAPGSVNNLRELDVTLEFSEWISVAWVKSTYVSQITISPSLARKLKFEIKGRKIHITSNSRLEPSTTYILSVNNSLADLNNQKLQNNFHLVFSTGEDLDSGSISGSLDNSRGSTEKIWLGLYPVGESRLTLAHLNTPYLEKPGLLPDPTKERPMYLIKVDTSGKFTYTGLKKGRYGILGFEDLNSNMKPDISNEKLAIGDTLFVDQILNLSMSMSQYNQVSLQIVSADWKGFERDTAKNTVNGILTLELNQPVKWENLKVQGKIKIVSADTSNHHSFSGIHIEDKSSSKKIELLVKDLSPDIVYVVSLIGIKDIYSNPLDSLAYEKSFKPGTELDTSGSSITIKAPSRNESSVILSGPVMLSSNHPLTEEDVNYLRENIYLELNKKKVTSELVQQDFRTLSLRVPVIKYSGQTVVIKQIKQQTVQDTLPPDSTSDSLSKSVDLVLADFKLADEEEWGSLEIVQKSTPIPWTVFLKKIPGKEEKKQILKENKSFILDSLIAGKYLVNYYLDRNNNGIWDSGSLKPWQSQEEHYTLQDTVLIEPSEKSTISLGPNHF